MKLYCLRHLARLVLLSSLVLSLGLPADAARRKRAPDFIEDVLAFATRDREKALILLDEALKDKKVMSKHATLVYLHLGEQNRLAGNLEEAHDWFVKVLQLEDKGVDATAARLGLTLIEAEEDGLDSQTLSLLEDIHHREVLDTQNADRYLHLAVTGFRFDDPKTNQYSRKALSYAEEDPEVEARVSARLDQLLGEGESEKSSTGDDTSADKSTGSKAKTPLAKAEHARAEGRDEEARKLAEKVLDSGSDEDKQVAEYLLRHLDAAAVDPHTIAVLLPMSGKYEAAARQVKQALEHGFDNAGAKLVYIDTGATPETAVAALEEAVFDKGAIAVVGPLLTDETKPMYDAAQAMRVPLISLSQALDPAEESEWVFQGMVTAAAQVEALLDYVMPHRGLESFAIFAPDSGYGHRAAEAFQEGVEERGGKVTVSTFYDAESTDLLEYARELGRKDYEGRKWEFHKMKEEAEERGLDTSKMVLPPEIDFDAIFIPDNYRRVPVACAALAYEEFPMGDFKPNKDESPDITLLGLSGWNNPTLVGQGGPYARGSLFTDSFLAPYTLDEDSKPAWRPDAETAAFVDEYRASTGRTPTPLEAVTVDVGHLLAATVAQEPEDREAFRNALLEAKPGDTITDATGFDDDRKPDWNLKILTINEDGIFPVDVPEDDPSPDEPSP